MCLMLKVRCEIALKLSGQIEEVVLGETSKA